MAINYRGTNPQDISNTSVRLEPVTSYDYSAYDSSSGEGAVENTTYWLVPDNFEYSSSVEFDKAGGGFYSASYFLVRPISITGSFYGDFNGTASYAANALSASYAPLSIDTSSFYISSPGNILFVNRFLIITKGDGNTDVIDLSTLEAASASYASYALTASYALSGGSGGGGTTFPYTGSARITGSLDVSGSIGSVDYVDFKTSNIIGTNEPAWKEGRVFYDSGSGALAVYNWEQDITLNVGQEQWLRARNQTGTSITNGTVVRLLGAIGDRPTVKPAQSTDQTNTFSTGNEIIGMATHDIEHGTDGFITSFGVVNGVNTAAFTAGDLLWVSQSAGQFTNIPPPPPFDRTFVGIVTRANVSNGSIFMTPLTPIHFHDISSVSASVYQMGDLWMYRSGSVGRTNAWINTKQLTGSYAISGSLNVNGAITGSLFGTSSWASSASNAVTASYILTAETALTASVIGVTPTGSTSDFYYPTTVLYPGPNKRNQVLYVSSSFYYDGGKRKFVAPTFIQSGSGYIGFEGSASYATRSETASYVNTLNQNVIVTGSLVVGFTGSVATENTLVVGRGPAGGAGEGGQIMLMATGGTYSSASMIDVWQDNFRILRGLNTGATVAAPFTMNLHSGNIITAGAISPSAWSAGQTIQTKLFSASDLSFTTNYTNATNTYSTIVSSTFTPLSATSYIFFEVYAMYDINGGGDDSFFSQITWDGNEIGLQRQLWANGAGGGTRSGTLFPLAGRVTNSSLTGYTWAVRARRDSSDDTITVYPNVGFYVKITEVGR
ncbi:hypothetical protein UFOVP450_201 [uncultured Caudovirales phage]|uniref:Uncharacterized protein n=1 Tax=uncultured Caudovirales phage TaxID=2100421 RepID=A0A6J5MAC9_9CAUD|nr:hypothetical protein UFOVP450_201 [uncultured Caudovirales phage]